MRLVFLGAPGSGKGTQAKMLMKKHQVPQISTGDLLRAAVKEGTQLGIQAKATMEAGQLVADEIVIRMISERLHEEDAQKGFILDGFPRSIPQAEALDKMLEAEHHPLGMAVLLDVPMDALFKRLTGRRSCSHCGALYNVYYTPPQKEGHCDKDGAELLHRADDNETTITNRLDVYQKQTAPLVDFYKAQGKFAAVDGERGMDEVFAQIEAAVKTA